MEVWVLGGVVVLLAIFVFLFSGKRKRLNTVLLVGPPGGGKTCMFVQLRDGVFPETVTSMKIMEGEFQFKGEGGKAIHTVAFPGHSRLRSALKDFLPITKCIVFVVDSVNLATDVRQYADYMFELLTNPTISNNSKLEIVIACNKQDAPNPLTVDFIKRALEREIDRLRKTRSTLLDQEGSDGGGYLGVEGEPFSFAHISSPVHFAKCSAKTNDLAEVTAAVKKCVG